MSLHGVGKSKPAAMINRVKDIPIPNDFAVGEVTQLWMEGGFLNAIVNGVMVNDLGVLGKEFVEKGLVEDGAGVSAVIGFSKEG